MFRANTDLLRPGGCLVALVLSVFVVSADDNNSSSSCRKQRVAWYYDGYSCSLTSAGIRSIPPNCSALRMLTVQPETDNRTTNLTLPSLPQLQLLEYDVSHRTDLGDRPFVQLTRLATLQLFHAVPSTAVRFQLTARIFDGLRELRQLMLPDLGLEDLPPGVFSGLTQLTILELHHNRISRIRADTFLGCCERLTVLTLSRNRIADLDLVSWSGLSNLETLDLSSNRLAMLKRNSFSGLRNATAIDLTRNQIRTIEPSSFAGLEKLRELTLNDNHLSNHATSNAEGPGASGDQGLLRGSFTGLRSLEMLELNNNNLSIVLPETFEDLRSLSRLDLAGNRIESLPGDCFDHLPHLTDLNLGGNRLTTVDQRRCQPLLRRLGSIDLSSNPWHCDCALRWLARWAADVASADDIEVNNYSAEMQCSTPKNLTRLTLEEVYGASKHKGLFTDCADIVHVHSTAESPPQPPQDLRSRDSTGRFHQTNTASAPTSLAPQVTDDTLSVVTSQETTSRNADDTPEVALLTVTENIRSRDDTRRAETLDGLLASVTRNLKALDSLLITTASNFRTLNRLLETTIENLDPDDRSAGQGSRSNCDVAPEKLRTNSSAPSQHSVTRQQVALLPLSVLMARIISYVFR